MTMTACTPCSLGSALSAPPQTKCRCKVVTCRFSRGNGWNRGDKMLAQAVTALAFSDDGCLLVSGGEDTVASAWLLADALDAQLPGDAAMQGPPIFHSWCDFAAEGRTYTLLVHLPARSRSRNVCVSGMPWIRSRQDDCVIAMLAFLMLSHV